jgi:hypothetical protein
MERITGGSPVAPGIGLKSREPNAETRPAAQPSTSLTVSQDQFIQNNHRPASPSASRPPALQFGIIDPISIGVIVAAGVGATGAAGTYALSKFRKRRQEKLNIKNQTAEINKFLAATGSVTRINEASVNTVNTIQSLLTDTGASTQSEPLFEQINRIIDNLKPGAYDELLQDLFLAKGISHPSPSVRATMINHLTREAATRKLYDPFLKQLEKETEPALIQSLEQTLLSLVTSDDVTNLQAELALDGTLPGFRRFAIKALSAKAPATPSIPKLFLELLQKEAEPEICTLLRQGIGNRATPAMAEPFLAHLNSTHPEVRKSAIQFLTSLNNPAHFQPLWEECLEPNSIALQPEYLDLTRQALNKLFRKEHLPQIAEALKIGPGPVRDLALYVLGNREQAVTAPHLIEPLLEQLSAESEDHPDELDPLKRAIITCAGSQEKATRTVALKKVNDSNPLVRQVAAQLLASEARAEDWPILLARFEQESDPTAKLNLVAALERSGAYPANQNTLYQTLATHSNPQVKQIAASLLKQGGIEMAAGLLTSLNELAPITLKTTAPDQQRELATLGQRLEDAVIAILERTENALSDLLKTSNSAPHPDTLTLAGIPRLQQKKVYFDTLYAALSCQSKRVQNAALKSLKGLASADMVEPLLKAYGSSSADQQEPLKSIIKGICTKSHTQILLNTCQAEQPVLRKLAAELVVNFTELDHLAQLMELNAAETDPQIKAIYNKDIEALMGRDGASSLVLQALENHANPAVKKIAAEQLIRTPSVALSALLKLHNKLNGAAPSPKPEASSSSGTQQVTDAIMADLKDKLPSLLASALQGTSATLNRSSLSNALQEQISEAVQLPFDAVQRAALDLMTSHRETWVIAPLFTYLASEKALHRNKAIEILHQIDAEKFDKDLQKEHMRSADPSVRALVASKFVKHSKFSDIPWMTDILEREESPAVQTTFLNDLKEFKLSDVHLLPFFNAAQKTQKPELFEFYATQIARHHLPALPNLLELYTQITALPQQGSGSERRKALEPKAEAALANLLEQLVKQEGHFYKTSVTPKDWPLLHQLLQTRSPAIQAGALNILALKNDALKPRPVEALLTYLKGDPAPAQAEKAISILSKWLDASHVPMLEEMLVSVNPTIQRLAAQTIKTLKPALELGDILEQLKKATQPELIKDLSESLVACSSSAAAHTEMMASLKPDLPPHVLSALLDSFQEHHKERGCLLGLVPLAAKLPAETPTGLRHKLFSAIDGRLTKTSNFEVTLQALTLPNETVQQKVLSLIPNRSDKSQFIGPLFDYLGHPQATQRTKAQEILWSLYTATTAPQYVSQLGHPHSLGRITAANALAALEDVRNIPDILAALITEKDQPAINTLTAALNKLGSREDAFTTILKAFKEATSPLPQKALAIVLAQHAPSKAIPVLLAAHEAITLPSDLPEAEEVKHVYEDQLKALIQQKLQPGDLPGVLAGLDVLASPSQRLQGTVFTKIQNFPNYTVPLQTVEPLRRYLESAQCHYPEQALALVKRALTANTNQGEERNALVSRLLHSSAENVQLLAAELQKNIVSEADLPALYRQLEAQASGTPNPNLIKALSNMISQLAEKPGTFQFLAMTLMEAENPIISEVTVNALQKHGAKALDPLFNTLENITDPKQDNLIRSLERAIIQISMDDQSANRLDSVPALVKRIKTTHKGSRKVVILALSPYLQAWETTGRYDNETMRKALKDISEANHPLLSEPAQKLYDQLVAKQITQLTQMLSTHSASERDLTIVKPFTEAHPGSDASVIEEAKRVHTQLKGMMLAES